MAVSTTPPKSGGRWELRDLALLAGLGSLAGASLVVWETGRIAGRLFGGDKPSVGLAGAGKILARLPGHLGDPRFAWPTPDQRQLPGPLGWYAALVLVLGFAALVIGGTTWAVLRLRRGRHGRPTDSSDVRSSHRLRLLAPSPAWAPGFARPADLQRLYVPAPTNGRITLGHSYRRLLAAELEQSVLVVGATRSGKTTGFAIPNLLEWDGPAVVLSAKTDLVHATHAGRAALGRVDVFDPTGVGGFDSSGWSPLVEATTWAGAVRIANAMSRLSGTTDGLGGSNHWQRVAAQLLGPLLHAAAIDERYGMPELLSWIKTQRVGPAMAALVRTENTVAAESLQSTLDTEQRQRDSAFNTVRTVLDAYEDPDVLATSADTTVEPAALLDDSGTLYLVASAGDQVRLAPLFLGLLDQVLRAAFLRATCNRVKHGTPVPPDGQRLLLLLDEAANIAPLPDLATLASTGGGEGIQLLTIFQDLSQLRHRYGSEWGSIASNHITRVLLPGVGDPETLRYFSQLSGDVAVLEESTTVGDGRTSRTQAPRVRTLLDDAALRGMPQGTGLLWTGTTAPARIGLRRPT
jgi:type IV secretion system protein VirD4